MINKTLNIGTLTLDMPFFQAPLSGYSDYAMRKLAKRFGSPLVFAGVMLAKSAANPRVIRSRLFQPFEDEHPVGAQLLGSDPQIMAEAAGELVNIGYDVIDLNFACPAPKVLRCGRGGALLNEPSTALKIHRAVKKAVNCPVIVKLRTGFDGNSQSLEKFNRIVEGCIEDNVDALVIHGRTVLQRFAGKADWRIIAELKQKFPRTTIIGSGDLFDVEQAVKFMRDCDIDGLAIARGAIGNPWIFRDLKAALLGTPKSPPSLPEQGQVMIEHFESILQLYSEKRAVGCFRKFALGYCRLHQHRKKVQMEIFDAKTADEVKRKIKLFYELA